MAACLDCCLRQTEVEKVGHGGECSIVSAHELSGCFLIAGIERCRPYLLVAGNSINPCRHFPSPPRIVVGKRD